MIFQLDDSVFQNEELWFDLNTFINFSIKTQRHKIILPIDLSDNYETWQHSLNAKIKYRFDQAFSFSLERIANIPDKKIFLVVAHEQESLPDKLSLDRAMRYSSKPFKIYIENGRNDKNFINFFCSSENRVDLLKLKEDLEIEFVNGGGITELLEIIKEGEIDKDYSFFLFDRDSLPFGDPSKQSTNLQQKCLEEGIEHHQLARRCIENYVPKKSLVNLLELRIGAKKTELKNKINSYFNITCFETRCHFNMKKGVKGDTEEIINDTIVYKNLENYKNVSDRDKGILRDGFGTIISVIYKNDNEKIKINESDILRDRNAYDEINSIVNRILRLI